MDEPRSNYGRGWRSKQKSNENQHFQNRERGGPSRFSSNNGRVNQFSNNIPSDSHRGSHTKRKSMNEIENNRGAQSESRPTNDHCRRIKRSPLQSFKYMENLLGKSDEDLVLVLSNEHVFLSQLTQTSMSNDFIILLIKILHKVSQSPFRVAKLTILQISFNESFVRKIKEFMAYLPIQNELERRKNSYFWKNPNEFWNNLLEICEVIYNILPTFACDTLPSILGAMSIVFLSLQQHSALSVSTTVKEKIASLQQILAAYEERNRKIYNPHDQLTDMVNVVEEEPPDDFREINVYPNDFELIGQTSFLRPNVVMGPYRSIEHYLDVQFRLLREDFVAPLRSGVNNYLTSDNKKQRNEQVRIHKKIQFICPEQVNECYCLRLQFDFEKRKKNFRYEQSKRFMFGSLLCFTRNSFKQIFFGRVAKRDIKDLENGTLIVSFDENPSSIVLNVDYLMVECNIFFEPYYHVLNALKNLSFDEFPMERYIIQVSSDVQPPAYLRLRPAAIRAKDLNESQEIAYNAALTQEFILIQGPPGTGKTYLGLKIVTTLLSISRRIITTPILVICYTNHALDQFLEGLLDQFGTGIIRVGSQSKNKKLDKLNLRNRSVSRGNAHYFKIRNEVKTMHQKIINLKNHLNDLNQYNGVVDFEYLVPFDKLKLITCIAKNERNDQLNWLCGGSEIRQVEGKRNQEDSNEENNIDLEINNNSDNDDEDLDSDNEDLNTMLDDIFVFTQQANSSVSHIPTNLITLKNVEQQITYIQNELSRTTDKLQQYLLEDRLNHSFEFLHYLKMRLAEGKAKQNITKIIKKKNPEYMTPDERWNLYFYLLEQYKLSITKSIEVLNRSFRKHYELYEELRNIEDITSMKEAHIIGMTTTSAARLRSSLEALKCQIVVVEEAAEVLESHIVAALTNKCQHLILLGDHQQLKPSTADFNIESKYKLGISLFERMVLNKIQCYTLNVQHRMRPEISALIKPTIYPYLEDHISVHNRLPIFGIEKCLYFISHNNREENIKDGTSKKNVHEAKFLIALARHIVLNGYKPEQITIIAAYLGQMFEIQKQKKQINILNEMRVVVLDNYQGEENDIILLSLVRNNDENNVGFLKIENRVCVALSRAKYGMYIMGNMDQLCTVSPLWSKIRTSLEQQEAVGPELRLKCQIHIDQITLVKTANDFLPLSEGGCTRTCDQELNCGHRCTKLCHILDRDHVTYQCNFTCNRNLCMDDESHKCKKKCYEECGPCNYKVYKKLPCGHEESINCSMKVEEYVCRVLVPTVLPCGHNTDRPCHQNPDTYPCSIPCEIKVEPCGHACIRNCHVNDDPDHLEYKCPKECARFKKGCSLQTEKHLCNKRCHEECPTCDIIILKNRTVCPHRFNVPCHLDVDLVECEKPCRKKLECGHGCNKKCDEPCGACDKKVEKTHPVCGHRIKTKCSEVPDRKNCTEKCPLLLKCGHPCTTTCNRPCTPHCLVLVDCKFTAKCGHIVKQIPCYQKSSTDLKADDLLRHCTEPCKKLFECGHSCTGNCGECFQGRSHKRCGQKCGAILICSHECKFPCREACRPCNLQCSYRCVHSRCGKRCGEPCTRCVEQCIRKCIHQKCNAKCGQRCTVPPCTKPCPLILKCEHSCVGFCSEPCPPCRICDTSGAYDIFFGTEDDEKARFVVLNDCKHVIENTAIEDWLKQDEGCVGFKKCPKCNTIITTTQRFSDYIKETHENVMQVKKKIVGSQRKNEEKRIEMLSKVSSLIQKCCRIDSSQDILSVIKKIRARLLKSKSGKRQTINTIELNAINAKVQILEEILKLEKLHLNDVNYEKEFQIIIEILRRETDYITNQEIDDVQQQLLRVRRINQYFQIKDNVQYLRVLKKNEIEPIIVQLEKYLFENRYETIYDDHVLELLEKLNKLSSTQIGLTDTERKQIVKALNLSPGRWYKCPNGHFYVITECGGAMIESTCNECGARIGGRNHAVRSDNEFAPEMDGASHPAWPRHANDMRNYML